MADEAAWWVPLAVAFIAGGGFKTVLEIAVDRINKATGKRRAEVDRMATLLAEAEAAKKIAERRERIATEWGHETRVVALQAGVPSARLPSLDFKDD